MCFFFHIMLNANDRLKTLSDATANVIRSDIYDMHVCESYAEFRHVAVSSMRRWQAVPEGKTFAKYFAEQWLIGRYWK